MCIHVWGQSDPSWVPVHCELVQLHTTNIWISVKQEEELLDAGSYRCTLPRCRKSYRCTLSVMQCHVDPSMHTEELAGVSMRAASALLNHTRVSTRLAQTLSLRTLHQVVFGETSSVWPLCNEVSNDVICTSLRHRVPYSWCAYPDTITRNRTCYLEIDCARSVNLGI